jgi:GT2 family glycosyltransferase
MSPLFSKTEEPLAVEAISGACLLTRRDVFQKVGGFNEEYFMYYEDMDYCLKVVRSGWKNYFVPSAVVTHHGGKSSGGQYSRFSNVMMAESGWRFFYRQKGYCYAFMLRAGLAAKAAFCSCLFGMGLILTFSKSKRNRVTGGFRKWMHLLRWCLGGERWLKNYRST